MFCKNCGHKLNESAAFCIKCGTARTGGGSRRTRITAVPVKKTKASKNRLIFIVLACIVGLVFILQIMLPYGLRGLLPPTHGVQVGDIIPFGDHYWRVLDVQRYRALIITENVIGQRWYNLEFTNVTWETSDIRQYLNSTFLNTFSGADRARILETTVVNNNNPWDWIEAGGHASTPGGNNTIDRIFLLSIDEVLQYFGDSGLVAEGAMIGANTRRDNAPVWPNWGIRDRSIHDQYSAARIARDAYGSAPWWLRSPGGDPGGAAFVCYYGDLNMDGGFVSWSGGGIRPALWLNLQQ